MKNTFILPFLMILLVTAGSFHASAQKKLLPTSLRITVIDGLGNYVEGATVKLFTSKEDYLNTKNEVATAQTNRKGQVTFKKLKPVPYFIDARTEDKNNDGEGVETQPLLEGRINKVNLVIE